MTSKPAKTRPVVDLTDLTLDELDEVAKLQEDGVGKTAAFAYVGLRAQGRTDLTIEAARKLTMRDVSIIESDPDEAEDDTPTNGR